MKKIFLLTLISILSLLLLNCKSTSTDSSTSYRVSLTAVPAEGGSVSPANGQHEEGTSLDISATPNDEWLFVRWEGDFSGTNATATITVDGDKNIEAIFEKKTYALTVTTTGEGTVSEQVIANKATDYESGTIVELTANPAEGWEFVEWQGSLTGTANPEQITIDEAKEVTAVFEKKSFALEVNIQGQGEVSKTPDQPTYEFGTTVELTATPADGWNFTEWQGAVTGSDNPVQVTITGQTEVTAIFSMESTSSFYLAPNGVTVKCEDVQVGDSGTVGGITYTKRTADQINISNAETTCTSEITDMSSLFEGAFTFNGNISSWDVGYVTDMSKMFANDTSFSGDISNWDVSSVTNMSGMFENAYHFSGGINGWDVSGVTDMSRMFAGTRNFDGILGSWDVSSVTDMSSMFEFSVNFNPTMKSKFLRISDIGNWDVSSVTDMSYMFYGATFFNEDINAWNVSNVTNMSGMFWKARSFNKDLNNWDVSSVTDMSDMFWDATSFNGDISSWDVSSVTTVHQMFFNARNFAGDVSSWNVSSVTDMRGMFMDATSFNSDISNWNVSNVTNIRAMFYDAESFNGDISGWEVGKVRDMRLMFSDAISFNSDISSWDVSSVTDMRWMFDGASSFNQDIGGWDVSNVNEMLEMFENASSFNQDLSSWCVSNIITEPSNFATGSALQESFKPVWGTCPGS